MDLKAVLVDDEQLARDELGFLLGQVGGVSVIGQAGDGVEALTTIGLLQPDVVFLDVQMPGLTGFEVARRMIDAHAASHIIFVTAYDQHAIEAFEVNAVDYLLKPVDPARLDVAVTRARRLVAFERSPDSGDVAPGVTAEQLEQIVERVAERRNRRERLALKVGERFVLVQADDVVFASLTDDVITVAAGKHVGTSNYRTLDELQERLDPGVFFRVHRSHLVNINKIKEIVPWFNRNYILRMKDEKATEIPVSRTQTRRLKEVLEALTASDAQRQQLPVPSPAIQLAQVKEELMAWIKTLASAAVYAVLIVTFGVQVARVEGQSMAPTLEDQDRLIVNKLVYRIGEPRRGDIVMLYYPLNPDKSFVKRVIAEEGDTVRIVDGRVYVNDIPLRDDYVPAEYPEPRRLGPAGDSRGLRLRDGRSPEQQLGQPPLGYGAEALHHRQDPAALVAGADGENVLRNEVRG